MARCLPLTQPKAGPYATEIMKYIVHTVLIALLCTAVHVQAATCRSGSAAAQGSQAGYKRDQQAAEQAAQSELSSSDVLGKCVGGITSVLTAPQFPSLSETFDQIKNKVCQIASSQVNSAISDVNGQINGAIGDIYSKINGAAGSQIPIRLPTPTVPSVQQTAPGSSASSAFWSDIWK